MDNPNLNDQVKGGKIGIVYLKEIWLYYNELRTSNPSSQEVKWKYINGVFHALGLEPTIQYKLSTVRN